MKSDYSIRLAAVTLFTMLAPSVIAGQDGHARHHHYQPIDTPEIPPNLSKRCTQISESARDPRPFGQHFRSVTSNENAGG
jgi:hypothetical protein